MSLVYILSVIFVISIVTMDRHCPLQREPSQMKEGSGNEWFFWEL